MDQGPWGFRGSSETFSVDFFRVPLIHAKKKKKFLTQLLVVAAAAGASACVTPILAANGCAHVPGYDIATDTAGPFSAIARNTAPEVEGHGGIFHAATMGGEYYILENNAMAKSAIRCHGAAPNTFTLETYTNGAWRPIKISDTPVFGPLSWGNIYAGWQAQAYWHDVEGQGRLYLGSKGNTTWAVKKVGDSLDWAIRFLGSGGSLQEGETATFLSIS
ncbi:hypothetical protein BDZ91DRAFT_845706 [Kalaharituber pfeilii]|nr:hypothetical protein BDZ91DRAFT_845706 [Kalaharituber pfeilii]